MSGRPPRPPAPGSQVYAELNMNTQWVGARRSWLRYRHRFRFATSNSRFREPLAIFQNGYSSANLRSKVDFCCPTEAVFRFDLKSSQHGCRRRCEFNVTMARLLNASLIDTLSDPWLFLHMRCMSSFTGGPCYAAKKDFCTTSGGTASP